MGAIFCLTNTAAARKTAGLTKLRRQDLIIGHLCNGVKGPQVVDSVDALVELCLDELELVVLVVRFVINSSSWKEIVRQETVAIQKARG